MSAEDYNLHPAVADMLKGVVSLPHELRYEILRDWFRQSGGCDPVYVLSQFIGMANSVVASNREMIEEILLLEGVKHPGREHDVNLPTMFGALVGVGLASKACVKSPCHGCAFRLGSPANQSPSTTEDVEWCLDGDDRFWCHEELDDDGNPTKRCAGFEKLMASTP